MVAQLAKRLIAVTTNSLSTKRTNAAAHSKCACTPPTISNTTKTMNTKDLIRLGVPVGEPIQIAHEFIQNFIAQGKGALGGGRLGEDFGLQRGAGRLSSTPHARN